MKEKFYIRTCTDKPSNLHYFEFVRYSDSKVLYVSTVFDFLHTYALGYTDALNAQLIIL